MSSLGAILTGKSTALAAANFLAQTAPPPHATHTHHFLHLLLHFGVCGVFFISIVDSSFIPLPLPGITDIMLIVLAAQQENWLLLVFIATAGSALGGLFSYKVGHSGGMTFLEKRIPARIFNRIASWMERHAFLSVALPAVLPPPMPLSPFVLAAGALHMSRRRFLYTFTISRGIRHAVAAWLGIHYGRAVIHLWNGISDRYATPILIALWIGIVASCTYAFWQLYKTSKSVSARPSELATQKAV